jgi:PmbA protein
MTNSIDRLQRVLEQARASGADCADAVVFSTADLSVSWRLGKPEGLERSESQALGLRVFSGAKQAIVSTTDLRDSALAELASRAVSMAKLALPDPDSMLAAREQLATSIPSLDLCDATEPTPAQLEALCAAAEDAARATPGITNSEGAEAHASHSTIALATQRGAAVEFAQAYDSSHFSLSVSVLAGSGTDMERDYDYATARHWAGLPAAETIGHEAAKRTVARLNARKIATCEVPVFFEPRVARGLLGAFASAISGSAVARGASFLKDAMGQAVFAPGITIIDDPWMPRGLASRPFDAEGVATRRMELVQAGRLCSWLLDVRSASKLGLTTLGHATRGVASGPSPSPSNLYIAASTQSPQALLREVGTGFFVTETSGMGVNTVTGDYSQGASGFWVEGGEIAYPVSEVTIAGRLQDMFAGLTAANDLAFRYSSNTPTLRVSRMTVAGA